MTTGCKSADAQATSRQQRLVTSPQWRDGRFVNALPRHDGPVMTMTREFFFGGSDHRRPTEPLPLDVPAPGELATPPEGGLRVTWLGHSTSLVEVDGARLLLDPMFGDRASPVSWAGPKRFYPPPVALEALPRLDAVLISHDHYDHLDRSSVEGLARREALRFVVPLGVGTRLQRWGIDAARVTELDWWQELRLGAVRVVLTPARHFSGRSAVMADKDETLWGGWAMVGPVHRVYYSGDSAMFPGFAEIGERLGPFDITLIESGAYNKLWADVHLGPEQAVAAHRAVRGKLMLPVHWGSFDLALHGWTEPAERLLVAAAAQGVQLALPRPGGRVVPGQPVPAERWWPTVPWETAEQAPVWSSGVPTPDEAAPAANDG